MKIALNPTTIHNTTYSNVTSITVPHPKRGHKVIVTVYLHKARLTSDKDKKFYRASAPILAVDNPIHLLSTKEGKVYIAKEQARKALEGDSWEPRVYPEWLEEFSSENFLSAILTQASTNNT